VRLSLQLGELSGGDAGRCTFSRQLLGGELLSKMAEHGGFWITNRLREFTAEGAASAERPDELLALK